MTVEELKAEVDVADHERIMFEPALVRVVPLMGMTASRLSVVDKLTAGFAHPAGIAPVVVDDECVSPEYPDTFPDPASKRSAPGSVDVAVDGVGAKDTLASKREHLYK